MRAVFAVLLRPVLYVLALAASWFGGRKAAETDVKLAVAEQTLKVATRAEEIENEVEALGHADLSSRSRKWVRGVNK
jgi:hypothetical protein